TSKKQKPLTKRRHLNSYCTNLTAKAAAGEIDAIIGRDREIGRVVQILSRRTKNNPCLIGEPGVGKTAIAEGLALRIAAGDVPARLRKKEIHLLDLTALVAGTQFRGQFESRIKGLVDEVKAEGNIILFIDEVHNLVGTGDAEGSMNAANILKPALSRGEIQVIGATTFVEYRKYIEKDAALERRFQPVTVAEPTLAEATDILMGIRSYYEHFHRVRVPDAIVRSTVSLSERYITDRFLPDKAIDLLDESCAHAALRNKQMADYDAASAELEGLHTQEEELAASDEPDYEKLAELRTKMVQLEEKEKELAPAALGAEVETEDLAKVIELWTGIPASRIQENELKKLSHFEEELNRHIIGQEEAVAAVAAAVRRSRIQISPRRRPASFIFVGPTGVGKTELVKVLSQELFDTPETLIRLDMSEFMEKHSVSRIIGSPPGYVGYDEAGQVTEKVRRRPYSVLLFDEIEKAHPDVLNILLQILDEGHVTDAHGRNVNFENTILVMTSNAGSERRESALGFAKAEADVSRERAMKALSDFLRPEFLARVDEVVVFRPLDAQDFRKIAALMLDEYATALKEKQIQLMYDDKATAWLADHAAGGKSGARDLRNLIRRKVEDALAELLIDACDAPPEGILITSDGEQIQLKTLPGASE
ncbi:MAG: ATP-dependent Clp protease ATP-binding subunit, partial [Hydrogeniiclostridium sp.]